MSTTLLPLVCPGCGQELSAEAEQRLLTCVACGLTAGPPPDGKGSVLVEIDRELVRPTRPLPAQGTVLLLPTWIITVDRESLGPIAPRLPDTVRVPAVGLSRTGLLLQFARHLTQAPVELRSLGPSRGLARSAELTVDDAFALAELVVLAYVDGWPPDEAVDQTEIPLGAPRLMDWPCALENGYLVDLVCGLTVHASLLGQGAPPPDVRDPISSLLADRSTVRD